MKTSCVWSFTAVNKRKLFLVDYCARFSRACEDAFGCKCNVDMIVRYYCLHVQADIY